jgi:hypothetical protein
VALSRPKELADMLRVEEADNQEHGSHPRRSGLGRAFKRQGARVRIEPINVSDDSGDRVMLGVRL